MRLVPRLVALRPAPRLGLVLAGVLGLVLAGAVLAGELTGPDVGTAHADAPRRQVAAAERAAGGRIAELPGWPLYDRLCLACHGAAGDGAGPAAPWLWPPPRDLRSGQLKWRSTPLGAPPSRADLRITIEHGVPGAGMPGFAGILDERQLDELTEVALAFAAPAPRPAAGRQAAGRLVALGAPPAPDAARGARLWQQRGCSTCHGAAGKGDGIAAAGLRDAAGRPAMPYDLAAEGGRRPRDRGEPQSERRVLALSVATGLSGTPMPGFALTPAELWALADFVLELRQRAAAAPAAAAPRLGALAPLAIEADRQARLVSGYWPGRGEQAAALFGGAIAPQGPPPPALAPAQASLSALQCARCHAAQFQQWRTSIHAAASSAGLLAQLVRTGKGELPADEVASCQRCHSPLAEQADQLPPSGSNAGSLAERWPPNPAFSAALRDQGVTCAACHVRGWHRYGPPRIAPSLLSLPAYPRTELAVYERADFCLPCHQLPPRQALAGRPLLNTYKEWLDGPYFRRGVQCQHCHMPNREHAFLGIHDPDTFRQGIAMTGATIRHDAAVTVRVRLTNAGAGHYLPTTPTPAVWLTIDLVDAAGQPIAGAQSRTRIGRHIAYVDAAWRELEDSRIAPGETLVVAKAWRGGRVSEAHRAVVSLSVQPDEYYERFYRMRLGTEKDPTARAGFERALARAVSSSYSALVETLAIPPPPP